MQKRYFWGAEYGVRGTKLYRFRTKEEREVWLVTNQEGEPVEGTNSEVRRVQRRMGEGEKIEFPVEV